MDLPSWVAANQRDRRHQLIDLVLSMKGIAAPRHFQGMQTAFCLASLFICSIFADDTSDRNAIDRTIAALNHIPRDPNLITEEAALELNRLPTVTPEFGIFRPQRDKSTPSDRPRVVISHEPWAEATIDFSSVPCLVTLETLNPRISNEAIHFITSDVAVADGIWTFRRESAPTQTVPMLFVLKKAGDEWRIEMIRALELRESLRILIGLHDTLRRF